MLTVQTDGSKDLGVRAHRVFVVWPKRAPFKEIHLLGYVEGVPTKNLENKILGEWNGNPIQVASSSSLRECFGNGSYQEEVPEFRLRYCYCPLSSRKYTFPGHDQEGSCEMMFCL